MESAEKQLLEDALEAARSIQSNSEKVLQYKADAEQAASESLKAAAAAIALKLTPKEPDPEPKGKHLHDYVNDIDYYSGKASEICRSLGFAGIAVVWIFRNTEKGAPLFPPALLIPLILLASSLAIDLLQYVIGNIVWTIFYRVKMYQWNKDRLTKEQIKDVAAPTGLYWTTTIPFWIKVVLMFVAYFYLFKYIYALIVIKTK